MNSQLLHPEVKRFKVYMEKHPDLKKAVKRQEKTLQELFEEWYWTHRHSDEKKAHSRGTESSTGSWGEIIGKLEGLLYTFNIKKWNQMISDIQGMLEMAQIYLAGMEEEEKNKRFK
ncbi:spore coat protein YlbD [Bacillus thermotolerans]|uniref:Uncharacterized protein n=1 Tax=Bacillus thermotolerans TaxID=1221996 RepID=A0A0F5I0Q7_BACTR|nr:spore coat protein YlbD [Bacillus thermotolerans]KKB39229.1 hypothetical protein QY97_00131 [Bacillus thermotolerans]KKB42244.1 hypothetical protein QY95_00093 [Bacillus thermotolerans]